jgi:hypothetical protein
MNRRWIGMLGVIAMGTAACDGGLSRGTALAAWNDQMARHPCRNVAFTDAQVTGITQKENVAEALLTVTGHYTGPRARPYELPDLGAEAWFGPCAGFTSANPGDQTRQMTLIFQKYDSGWRIEGMQ